MRRLDARAISGRSRTPQTFFLTRQCRGGIFFSRRARINVLQWNWGTKLCSRAFSWSGEIAMSVLSTVLTGWLVLNGAVFAALLFRRPRAELRSRLFLWILRSDHARRAHCLVHPLRVLARGK